MTAAARPRVASYVFAPHSGAMYGGERSLTLLLSHLREHDATVIVNRDDALAATLRDMGVEVVVLPAADPFTGFRAAPARERVRRIAGWARHNADLARALRRIRPDVVHANDLREVVMGGAALLLSRRPLVTHVRGEMSMRLQHQAALALSARSISISEGLLEGHLARIHPRLRERIRGRAVVVRNGVDREAAAAHAGGRGRDAVRARLGIGPDEVVVLAVGSLEPAKGQLELVEQILPGVALAVPELRVLIAGGTRRGRSAEVESGAFLDRVAAAVDAAGLTRRVDLLGFRDDVADLYLASDVLAQPSTSEGLGRTAIEAAASGRPVVAFDLPGINETVIDGETGRLVAPGDHAAFADALVALCRDGALRRRLGEGGRRLARTRFDPAASAAATEAVFLAARGARSTTTGTPATRTPAGHPTGAR